jgi:UDP-N-acetyl-D-galactosamine dehydrogenase
MKIVPSIIGLGYVGLPIFISLQKKFRTIGFDVDRLRISNLNKKIDSNIEFPKRKLILKNKSYFTSNFKKLRQSNFFIVTVPTPIYKNNLPNLEYLKKSCLMIGKVLKKGDIVFFESTVYPGVTENFCAKILEKESKLLLNDDFNVGYSPERINPGDKKHSIDKIYKIISANNPSTIKIAKKIYGNISKKLVTTFNIKEAESAKVIENIQRDLNIGLMNEIYKVCYKSKINFKNVIKLASTKWNFLKFKPGLVGGHCLPVDPYYYSAFAKKYGVKTNIILSGRKVNNSMYKFVYLKLVKKIKKLKIVDKKSKLLILGLTYKKNVSDIRNSFPINIVNLLKKKFKNLHVCDPLLKNKKVENLKILSNFKINDYDLIINLVNHDIFKSKILNIKKNKKLYLELF